MPETIAVGDRTFVVLEVGVAVAAAGFAALAVSLGLRSSDSLVQGFAAVATALATLFALLAAGDATDFLRGGRWRGSMTVDAAGITLECPAIFERPWRIDRADVAVIRVPTSTGRFWQADICDPAPRDRDGPGFVRPWGGGSSTLSLRFARQLDCPPAPPPSGLRRIAGRRRALTMAAVVLPARGDTLPIKHAFEAWGSTFDAA